MQKFIVTITDPGEPIVNDENAVCHVLNSELPAARLKELIAELRRTESLILGFRPRARQPPAASKTLMVSLQGNKCRCSVIRNRFCRCASPRA